MTYHDPRAHWALTLPCSNKSCGERARLTESHIFTVMVKGKFGGTQKQAAFACKRCGMFTHLNQQMMPKGMFESLPDRQGQMQRLARRYAFGLASSSNGMRWRTGPEARTALAGALAGIHRLGAAIALAGDRGLEREIALDVKNRDMSAVLEQLDASDCHLLVCVYLDISGRQKAVAFHETAGFAEF